MNHVFARMPNPDGNFITDFQTVGFDARVWEFYLFAALTFTGFDVSQPCDQPDFLARRFGESAWIEAVTASPSQGATETVEIPIQRIIDDLLPIRYGTPLRRKLAAQYWKRPHVAEKRCHAGERERSFERIRVTGESHEATRERSRGVAVSDLGASDRVVAPVSGDRNYRRQQRKRSKR
jgi:hypothetical protein